MTQQVINIGSAPNDGTGDQLRTAFDKSNDNFGELYSGAGTSSEGVWNYNQADIDTTTSPVSGRFKTNSGNYRDATQLAIYATTIRGIDRTNTLRRLLVGDVIECHDSTVGNAWCRYVVQADPVDYGTWFQINVGLLDSGAAASGDNSEIDFFFTANTNPAPGGTSEYRFSTSTTPPPGNGYIRCNNASLGATTVLYVNKITNNGTDIGRTLTNLTVGQELVIQDQANSANFGDYQIASAVIDQTSYVEIPVTATASGGAITNNSVIAFIIIGGGGGAAGGNVSNVGTPTNGQLARWTDATHIEGIDASSLGYQPLDADLTALAGIAGVQGDIIYRNVSAWTRLAAGTSGQFLQTLGGGANPQWATPGGGNVSNVGTPISGQFAQWTGATTIQGVSAASAGATLGITPASGRLEYSSPTQLLFKPFAGNKIKINGALLTIPNAGIAGLANTGVYVNTVAGQNLAANTVYWIYAFNNAGTVTADFFTGPAAHSPSTKAGNEGIEIKTGFDGYSLIGMCRTNASAQFIDSAAVRGVLSWFNRRPCIAQGKFTAHRSTTSATFVEINSEIAVGFLTWGESAVVLNISGSMANQSGLGSGTTALAVDGTNLTGTQIGTSAATNYAVAVNITAALGGLDTISEGYHTASLYGQANSGTQTWYGGTQGACTLTAQIMG